MKWPSAGPLGTNRQLHEVSKLLEIGDGTMRISLHVEQLDMNLRRQLDKLVGQWTGINRLWLSPDDPARESETTASIALVAGQSFATIHYTWEDEGQPQDGLLIVRNAAAPSPEDMTWIDSWHTGGKFMFFRGENDDEGRISGLGSYPAPSGPDWGWRIVLVADTADTIRMLMYNITPDGEAALAVEAEYSRASNS